MTDYTCLYSSILRDKINSLNIYEQFNNEKNSNINTSVNNNRKIKFISKNKLFNPKHIDINDINLFFNKINYNGELDVYNKYNNLNLIFEKDNINYVKIFKILKNVKHLFLNNFSGHHSYNYNDIKNINKYFIQFGRTDKLNNLKSLLINTTNCYQIISKLKILLSRFLINLNNKIKFIHFKSNKYKYGLFNYLPSSILKLYSIIYDDINSKMQTITFPNSVKYISYETGKFIIPFNAIVVSTKFNYARTNIKNKLTKLKVFYNNYNKNDLYTKKYKAPFSFKKLDIYSTNSTQINDNITMSNFNTVIFNHLNETDKSIDINIKNNKNVIFHASNNNGYINFNNNLNILCLISKKNDTYLTINNIKNVNYFELNNIKNISFKQQNNSNINILCNNFEFINKNWNCIENDKENNDTDYILNRSLANITKNTKIIINTTTANLHNLLSDEKIKYKDKHNCSINIDKIKKQIDTFLLLN
jgi:hypothetical protein